SPVRPRGVWCSWTTKVVPSPAGSGCPSAGTGSAVRAGSRLARYSASGSPPPRRAGTSGAAAGALGRRLVGGLLRCGGGLRGGGGGLLRGGRRPLRGGGLLHRRGLLRRGPRGGSLLRRCRLRRRGLRVPASGPLDRRAQRAHQVDDRSAGVG